MIRASLSAFSDHYNPNELTALVGLQPDLIWRSGEPYPGKGALARRRRKNNCWRISDDIGNDGISQDPVMDVVTKVLQRVKGLENRFQDLRSKNCRIEFSIYVLARQVPPVSLTLEALSAIVCLGAYLDVDVVLSD